MKKTERFAAFVHELIMFEWVKCPRICMFVCVCVCVYAPTSALENVIHWAISKAGYIEFAWLESSVDATPAGMFFFFRIVSYC